jgi:anhydro-N-acetylmuramic acid kinase
LPFPKSLSNDFGLLEVFPLIENANLSAGDALATYVEHIVQQIVRGIKRLTEKMIIKEKLRLLITGGGAHNGFLVQRIRDSLSSTVIECVVPSENLVNFKEALVIALMGVLRWREDVNVLHTITGASKDSINGAVWSV